MNFAAPLASSELSGADSAGALLTIDLGAIAANYRLIQQRIGAATCGAVVKADAYGLGAATVAPALFTAGCRHFFVAHLDEGVALRRALPADAAVYIMHGVFAGGEAACVANDLVPVSNSRAQLARWAAQARAAGRRLPAIIQLDTGMARFGFAVGDLAAIGDDLRSLALHFVMSHLACADTPSHPANAEQRARFDALRAELPPAPATLAASSGCFLDPAFHYDLVRPGAALYGVAPAANAPNPMHQVIRLDAKIVQLRDVPAGTPIGYGHSARTAAPARLATIAVGYADGYLRSGSNHGAAWFGDIALPIMGRVSMDSIVLDASAGPPNALHEGSIVELIGPHRGVDAVAADAGTIGYEVLTSLGRRYHRRYISEGPQG
jgi:alanine racemase